MRYEDLLSLVSLLATHAGRSEMTVARWCGVHGRLFKRLREGHGCRVDTFNAALQALSDQWPADLAWPPSIPRPPKSKKKEAA